MPVLSNTHSPLEPIRFEPWIARFARDASKQNNPRSRTRVFDIDGVQYHFKWSSMSLAAEAAQLQQAGRLEQPQAARAAELEHYDDDRNVLITRYVAGQSVFNDLCNGLSWRRFVKRYERPWTELLTALPRWLEAYHSLSQPTPPGDAAVAVDHAAADHCRSWLANSFHSKLSAVAEHPDSPLAQREVDLLLAHVERSFAGTPWRDLTICTIHGDFAVTNLLLDTDHVIRIIDFADSRQGFALEDFTRLWCSSWEIATLNRAGARVLHPILQEMLDAYGRPDAMPGSPFHTLRLWNAVVRIAENCLTPFQGAGLSMRSLHRRLTARQIAFIHQTIEGERPA